jgi:hypothetical protein
MARIVPEGGFQLQPFRRPRERRESHKSFIKRLPCVCCVSPARSIPIPGARNGDRKPFLFGVVDPAHIRAASELHGKRELGGGETADDHWLLPLCRGHHDIQHSMNELAFWRWFGIDPFLLALVLYGLSGDEHNAKLVILFHTERGAQR